MHIFMLDWFIPNVATSASNVRSQLTSLSQYIKFLADKGFDILKYDYESYLDKKLVENKIKSLLVANDII